MIRPASQLDWYAVSQEIFREYAKVPGARAKYGQLQLHRTHLPLVQALEAARVCTPPTIDHAARQRLDASTQDRGFTLRPHQHDAVEFIKARRGTLVADEPRVGKGQPLSAKILTPSGWTTMGELQVGSIVCDPDGGAARVLGIFPQGVKRIYRVTTTDGGVTECDEEHLWLVQTSRREWAELEPRVIATKELLTNLRLKQKTLAKSQIPPSRWILPLTQPIEYSSCSLLPITPYVLGLLLGDGCLRNGVSITNASDEVAVAVRREAERLGCQVRVDHEGNTSTYHLVTPNVQPNAALAAIRELDLFGCYSYTKFVPDHYLRASVDARRALLAGLLDTDGEVTNNGTTLYSTTSDRLRDDVIQLVRSLGGIAWSRTKPAPKYRHKDEERIGRPCHVVTVVLQENPFYLRRKAEAWKPGQRRRKIASIEYLRDEETRCIRVSSKRSLYITNDFIVTHNTLESIMSHDPSLGSLVVIAPLMVRETWLGWLRKVFPGEDIGVMIGKTFDRSVASRPIVVGHYQIAHAWSSDQPIGTLIGDEIHDLSNAHSKRTVGFSLLASRAERVVGLTGTPIWNKPKGLWSILSMLSPGAFGSFDDFGQRYCDPQPTAYGTTYNGSTNAEELDARLSQIKIRRRHSDVQADLPPITRDVIVADVSEVQRRRLDIESEKLRKSDLTNTAGQLARYRAVLGEVKLNITAQHVKHVLSTNEPIVVWTWHKSMARRVHQRLIEDGLPAYLISGDIPPAKREERLIEWKQGVAALVMTIPTGFVGIDLAHAKRALFVEIDYTPALMEQAEKRTYSPMRPSYITYVVADHISDRRILEALVFKLSASKPLGLTAAEGAIDLLQEMFGTKREPANMNRLMEALLEYEDAA